MSAKLPLKGISRKKYKILGNSRFSLKFWHTPWNSNYFHSTPLEIFIDILNRRISIIFPGKSHSNRTHWSTPSPYKTYRPTKNIGVIFTLDWYHRALNWNRNYVLHSFELNLVYMIGWWNHHDCLSCQVTL